MEDVLVWKKRREKSEKDRGREGGMLTWCIRRCLGRMTQQDTGHMFRQIAVPCRPRPQRSTRR